MTAHEIPYEFCDDSGAVVHEVETEQSPGVGVILWSARSRQMRAMVLRDAKQDSMGFHVLVTALEEMLRDD